MHMGFLRLSTDINFLVYKYPQDKNLVRPRPLNTQFPGLKYENQASLGVAQKSP